ncbi:MAG TPA: hypothetical protein VGE15_00975 [Sphingobacteriaceae bacterium]
MKGLCILSWFILFGALNPSTLRAQTYAAVEVTIMIPEIMVLQPVTSPPLNFDFNSTATLDQGINITGTTIRYYSNKSYFVTIQTGSANFSGGSGTMPVSVLKFKNSQSSIYTDLKSTPQALTGTAGAKLTRGTGTFGIDFRMDPGYQYPPADNYSVTVVYTISNQ